MAVDRVALLAVVVVAVQVVVDLLIEDVAAAVAVVHTIRHWALYGQVHCMMKIYAVAAEAVWLESLGTGPPNRIRLLGKLAAAAAVALAVVALAPEKIICRVVQH